MCWACGIVGLTHDDASGSGSTDGASVVYSPATGGHDIDGLLSGLKWSGTLTYGFPDSAVAYEAYYGYGEPTATGFAQVSTAQQAAVHTVMGQVARYTNLDIQFVSAGAADIRVAQSSEANPTAYAYYPGAEEGGDVWFGTEYNYRSPKLGDYYYLTHIHELGHALGLKHSHVGGGPSNVAVPSEHDALEYTVMSYRTYVGGPTTGYTAETYGYPTTFMMNDIRALQEMYGADFTTESGDTVYTWNASTGEFSINGSGQGRPGGASAPASANVVFMTVWDGGGADTYDLSNYSTGVSIDLNPGGYSITSSVQVAYLGSGHYAHGNVYNAYLYNGDTRSLIENAVGGSGADTIVGNAGNNSLDGRAGADVLTGGSGDDVFVFRAGFGNDTVTDFAAGGSTDRIDLSSFSAFHSLSDVLGLAQQPGANTTLTFSFGLTLTLQGVTKASLSAADFIFALASDLNNPPSSIALSRTTVAENSPGATIGAITVSDPDGDTAFDFSVSDGRFEVSGGPGAYVLELVAGQALDFEATASIALRLTATDGDGLSLSKEFTIGVVNVDGATISGTDRADTVSGTVSAAGQARASGEGDTVYGRGSDDRLWGEGGADRIDGGHGKDVIWGGAGEDILTGGAGADKINGGAGNDTFVIEKGDAAADVLCGGDGLDAIKVVGSASVTLGNFQAATSSIESWIGNGKPIFGTGAGNLLDFGGLSSVTGVLDVDGGAGNDNLVGPRFDDSLRGGAGNDRVVGGRGDDMLAGGAGADRFVFGVGFGRDSIKDFSAAGPAHDLIGFQENVFADYASVRTAAEQVGNDVVITDGASNTITLKNVQLAQLDASDFFFV